jgi:hypothetical protein
MTYTTTLPDGSRQHYEYPGEPGYRGRPIARTEVPSTWEIERDELDGTIKLLILLGGEDDYRLSLETDTDGSLSVRLSRGNKAVAHGMLGKDYREMEPWRGPEAAHHLIEFLDKTLFDESFGKWLGNLAGSALAREADLFDGLPRSGDGG